MASLALAPAMRAPVLQFYRFVRVADDIADAPGLSPERNSAASLCLRQRSPPADQAEPLAPALATVDRQHGAGAMEALFRAFRRDATSAPASNGRISSPIAASPPIRWARSCFGCTGRVRSMRAPPTLSGTALQILNHLQDLAFDRELWAASTFRGRGSRAPAAKDCSSRRRTSPCVVQSSRGAGPRRPPDHGGAIIAGRDQEPATCGPGCGNPRLRACWRAGCAARPDRRAGKPWPRSRHSGSRARDATTARRWLGGER